MSAPSPRWAAKWTLFLKIRVTLCDLRLEVCSSSSSAYVPLLHTFFDSSQINSRIFCRLIISITFESACIYKRLGMYRLYCVQISRLVEDDCWNVILCSLEEVSRIILTMEANTRNFGKIIFVLAALKTWKLFVYFNSTHHSCGLIELVTWVKMKLYVIWNIFSAYLSVLF